MIAGRRKEICTQRCLNTKLDPIRPESKKDALQNVVDISGV